MSDPIRLVLLRECVRRARLTARAELLVRRRREREQAAWRQLAQWDADRREDARAVVREWVQERRR